MRGARPQVDTSDSLEPCDFLLQSLLETVRGLSALSIPSLIRAPGEISTHADRNVGECLPVLTVPPRPHYFARSRNTTPALVIRSVDSIGVRNRRQLCVRVCHRRFQIHLATFERAPGSSKTIRIASQGHDERVCRNFDGLSSVQLSVDLMHVHTDPVGTAWAIGASIVLLVLANLPLASIGFALAALTKRRGVEWAAQWFRVFQIGFVIQISSVIATSMVALTLEPFSLPPETAWESSLSPIFVGSAIVGGFALAAWRGLMAAVCSEAPPSLVR